MAVRPIDAIELQKRMCALCNQDYADEPCEPSDCIFIRALNETPTLTQPNESLTCEGCIYEHNEHENCNYCKRAPYLGDYYYRRPPEGEEEI